tara:strand:- start:789 stop:1367 length:579 start_codon:yes stop_codon:yes gene_type:complete
VNEIFLPHTVFYTNVEHKENNPQWKETTYPLSAFIEKGLLGATDIVQFKNRPPQNTFLEELKIHKLEITCQDAFMYSLKNKMFSMGQFIRVNFEKQENPTDNADKFNVEYPEGFCPEFIHLIGKRGDDWLTLISTFNGDINYGDLAYVPHRVLTFALKYGHYTLSPSSPVISPLLEDKPEGRGTDWDQLLNN